MYVFLAASATFAIMAFVGYTTSLDLSKLRYFIPVSLIVMLLMGFVLMISFNSVLYLVYTLLGLGLMMIITTYDIHIIKRIYNDNMSDNNKESLAIYGALSLYLDFINIFIRLLSLFGRFKD